MGKKIDVNLDVKIYDNDNYLMESWENICLKG
jgi:hypothetical protein